VKNNADAVWDTASAASPAPDVPRADSEPLSDAMLSERAEYFAKFDR
jgi:hypothetical protein